MANLENNNDNENKKSAAENIGDSVQKGVENVKETVKGAAELASDAITHPVETAGEFVEQAAKDVTNYKWWAKLLLVLFWVSLFLVAAFFVVVSMPATKNWAAQKVIAKLNKDMKSPADRRCPATAGPGRDRYRRLLRDQGQRDRKSVV